MKISKRLQAIADCIPVGSYVIDVGCDHALLDIYLSLEKHCKCIATDINRNAIAQAKYNIARFNANNIFTVLTDGLNGIEVSQDNILVISGMGASTILNILENKKLSNTLIICAHNDWANLRHVVTNRGYKIVNEKFVIDNGKNYIIIVFSKGKEIYIDQDYIYGPILKKNAVYLDKLYEQTEEIYNQIPNDNTDKKKYRNRLQEIEILKKELK